MKCQTAHVDKLCREGRRKGGTKGRKGGTKEGQKKALSEDLLAYKGTKRRIIIGISI